MEIFEEYRRLVELYDNDATKPFTKNELVNICYLPDFYSKFGLNTEHQILALSSKHLYTMQVSKKDGYYKETSDTHYHNLGKENMLLIPELLAEPDFVLYDQSYNDKKREKLPNSLVVVLPKKTYSFNKENKEFEKKVLVAYIEEPEIPNDKRTILATSFNRTEIERYLNNLINKNRLLYLNEKMSLSTDYPGIQFPNIAIHSNGETRNSMAFIGSLNNNIRQYRENVNVERMKVSGLYLENIPDDEKTKKVCNAAFENNPASIIYFPDNVIRQNKYERDVFESLNSEAIQSMPDTLFINNLKYFLQHTDKANHQGKILYRTINKRLSDSQKTLLCETINSEHEPDEIEIVSKFVDWSEENLHEKSLPKNVQTHKYKLSEQAVHSEPIEVIGKHFETDMDGKFTLESFKDIAKTMQIYSDKRYETARYLFVKDGQIMRHIAISSQTPASTIIKPDDNFLHQIRDYAQSTGSKIVFLHNHPSGYVEPSEADINLTSYMQNFFQDDKGNNLFEGHIILDHGNYGLYTAESKEWKALINGNLEPLSKIAESYKVQLSQYGMKVNSENNNSVSVNSLKQLSDYAKKCDAGNLWNTQDWIPAFMMTGNGVVTSLEYINKLEFNHEATLSTKLKALGRACGSENIVLLPQHYDQFLTCERFAQITGKVKDIYFENPDGTYETSQFRNGNIFNDLTRDEIKVQDTNDNPELVIERLKNERTIYTRAVNKNINNNKENENMEKNIEDIIDEGVEAVSVNGGASEAALERDYMAAESENVDIDEEQRQMNIFNGLTDEDGNEIIYEGPTPETVAKDAATNFVLDKLEKSEMMIENSQSIFTYDGLTYIPIRKITNEEYEMVLDRKPGEIWKSSIIEKPKNGKDYDIKDFKDNSPFDADIFYCMERGAFFTPTEKGIINLNVDSLKGYFDLEKETFREKNKDFILEFNKPSFNKESDMELISNLKDVLNEGEVFTRKNETLETVRIKLGNPEHDGVKHIIKRRMDKLILNQGYSFEEAQKETALILFCAINNIDKAPATKETNGRYAIYKNGIKTALDKDKKGFYIVTGFDFDDTKLEAAETIKSVNARYGYAPEFLEIYAQVGAAYASMSNLTQSKQSVKDISPLQSTEKTSNKDITGINNSVDENSDITAQMREEFQRQMEEMRTQMQQMKEQYQLQISKMQEMIENDAKEKQELQNKIDMFTQQMKEDKGMAAHENQAVSGQGGVSAPVMQEQSKQAEISRNFNRDSAYIVNTKVPKFGLFRQAVDDAGNKRFDENNNPVWDKSQPPEIIKNAVFKELKINEEDPSKNTVIISLTSEDGSPRNIEMPEKEYNEIIVAEQNFRKALDGVSQDSWDWMKAHVDHDKRLHLDYNTYRLNTPEDFIHNFRIHCRKEAKNPQEAMKIAAWMVERMSPIDRKRFVKDRKEHDKKNGEGAYDRDFLLKEFENTRKERNLNPYNMDFEKDKEGSILETASIDLTELKPGELIEGTKHTKVGDIIPMAISTRDIFNKTKLQTPKEDYKILKVSKGLYPEDKIILYNERSRATYTMPLKDVVQHIQKIERIKSQDKAEQIKKDNKRFEFDIRGR